MCEYKSIYNYKEYESVLRAMRRTTTTKQSIK